MSSLSPDQHQAVAALSVLATVPVMMLLHAEGSTEWGGWFDGAAFVAAVGASAALTRWAWRQDTRARFGSIIGLVLATVVTVPNVWGLSQTCGQSIECPSAFWIVFGVPAAFLLWYGVTGALWLELRARRGPVGPWVLAMQAAPLPVLSLAIIWLVRS